MYHGRAYWEKRGKIAGSTKERTEKYCAKYLEAKTKTEIQRLGGGGAPDILSFGKRKKKIEFYEVKPYLLWLHERRHRYWNHAPNTQRRLSEPQRKAFKKMIRSGITVYIIYYDRETFSDKTERLSIHEDVKTKGRKQKPNPRKVTMNMLRTLKATDPYKGKGAKAKGNYFGD